MRQSEPPGAPKPTKLDQFLASHPAAVRAGATVHTPKSFATEEYFGIDAFRLTNKAGEQRFVRYRLEPVAGVTYLTADKAAKQKPDFLSDSNSFFFFFFFFSPAAKGHLLIICKPTGRTSPGPYHLTSVGAAVIENAEPCRRSRPGPRR